MQPHESFHDERRDTIDLDMLEEAHRMDGAYDLLEEKGVRNMANEYIEAHGRRMSVAQGIAECPPFANAVINTVDELHDIGVTDPTKVEKFVRKTLVEQSDNSKTPVTTEAEKK